MRTREIQGGVQAARALINKSIIIILKSKIKKQMERDLLSPESLDTLLSSEGLTSLLSEVCTVLTRFTVSCDFQCLILILLVFIKYYLTWASPCSSDLYSHYAPVRGDLNIYTSIFTVLQIDANDLHGVDIGHPLISGVASLAPYPQL